MYYLVETDKSLAQAALDLVAAVKQQGFGVMHVHDVAATLRSKGIAFDEECQVFEVCQPGQAAKILGVDMRLSVALPCRISVFTEQGQTKIALIRPVPMFEALSQDAALLAVAQEVEAKMCQMIEAAR